MRIDIEQSVATGPASIRLSHGNDSMLWDTATYAKSSDRKSPMNPTLIFKEINGFWESLPQAEQTQYWELYVEARQILDNTFDLKDIQTALQEIVTKFYDLPSMEKLQHWVIYRSGVRVPADLKETFEDVGADNISYPHRKEKTYLRGEYLDLVAMTVSLRIMVPIWAEFIRITRRQAGGNSKELEAFRLLYFSRINYVPAMQRLLSYVQLTVSTLLGNEVHATAILNGMGSVEFSDWMLAMTIVRRLSMCPISSEDDVSNVITNVYQYVKMSVKGSHKRHSKKFGGKVTLRKANEVGEDGQKKTSAEVYKVKQEVPDGVRVLMRVYMSEPQRVLYRALGLTKPGSAALVQEKPDGLDTRLQQCLDLIHLLPDFVVMQHHVTLAQWSLAHVMPVRGIPQLTLEALKKALAVAQCVLWEWGYYDLAALITAKPYEMDDDMMLGAPETRTRIPKEMLEELNRRWPYIQPSRGKQSFRQSNVAAKAIDMLCDHLTLSDWVLCCPKELVERVSRGATSRRFTIPGDIRGTLAQLLMSIEQIQKEETT